MILLSLQGIQKSFGTNEVLRDASLVLQDGQRMGLVGVNGCGKSTLMKIIAGIETADGGTMTMQKGLKLGYLAQQGQVGEGRTVLEGLESVFEPVQRMEQQLRDLEHQMADPFIASAASTTSLPAALRKATAMAGARRCRACWRVWASARSSRDRWLRCFPAANGRAFALGGCC